VGYFRGWTGTGGDIAQFGGKIHAHNPQKEKVGAKSRSACSELADHASLLPVQDVDWPDDIGKRAPIVISGVPQSVHINPGIAFVRRRARQIGEDRAAGV
jgi:hypothetical protein